jgi:hypothetical protein
LRLLQYIIQFLRCEMIFIYPNIYEVTPTRAIRVGQAWLHIHLHLSVKYKAFKLLCSKKLVLKISVIYRKINYLRTDHRLSNNTLSLIKIILCNDFTLSFTYNFSLYVLPPKWVLNKRIINWKNINFSTIVFVYITF